MLRAISRYFRALGYAITGRIDAARVAISSTPNVMNATYDQVIEDRKKRITQYKDAIARLIVQHEEKMGKIKLQTEEINKLERLREGAAAKARLVVNQLKAAGIDDEGIKANEDYRKCLLAFNDFTAKIQEKTERIAELEKDTVAMDETIKSHKIQLQEMMREIDTLRAEQATAVAEMITAKEEQQINDMLSGISSDRTSRELSEMRQLREQAKANARVSRELAGTDTKAQEAEFLHYAQQNVASDEFDRLIGLAGEVDQQPASQREKPGTEPRLPE